MIFSLFKKKPKAVYPLTWVTSRLAVGHAPMTVAELESIRQQGIGAIMNLCLEIKELVRLEEEQGFEVYFLPIQDEGFPDMAELEKALDWLDECIYLGKKVLVHCRFGIGRTGTVVYSYLLRKGYNARSAAKKMRGIRSQPTEQPQKRFLHQYWKKEKPFKIPCEPCLVPECRIELQPYYDRVRVVLNSLESDIEENKPRCGKDHSQCCFDYVEMSLAEAVYLQYGVNTRLSRLLRDQVIEKSLQPIKVKEHTAARKLCPLLKDNLCLLYEFRPGKCRVFDRTEPQLPITQLRELEALSHEVLEIFLEEKTPYSPPQLDLCSVVSGKFVQHIFHLMAKPV
jgi:protein-tyrosine phosphatase/Fe-S-cluster containining protein